MTRFAGGPSESPGFLLWHATMRWQRAMTAALAPLDLTHVQFVLLACAWWLGGHGEPPRQSQVAAQAGTDPKMTSDVVARLEAKGLLRRTQDPTDARAKFVLVTPAGAELAARAITVVEDADAAFFAGVDARDLLSRLAGLA
ncbi:MarR family winged helix-turn-helix transcriptional regulator [Cellulomonas sp. URHD0024]|uniref:MarR family winged helix-turn-helix transcriptional regulator n=1 Tax=Cellulomonas sp. URHD0024 TaxID=1302620 RepID=UPI000415C26A|nr:MarR family winged helix-turn-helix transcriptional regulator [Cellulomonas sp. URHD0024]